MRAELARAASDRPPAAVERAEVAEFHDAVAAAFGRAASALPLVRQTYQIGDGIVRIEFAGDAFIPAFTRAIAHLNSSADRAPDLTIGIWEIESSGIPLPPPPWTWEALRPRGEVLDYSNDAYATTFHPDGRVLFLHNIQAARGYVAVFDHKTLPGHELAAPLRAIFSGFLETRGVQFLHAGAVGTPDGGVLLIGRSGSGKSTTALACLESELLYAGDDYCAVTLEDAPTVYSLYSSGKALGKTPALLPWLEPLIANRETLQRDRAIWYLNEAFPTRLIRQFPLRALLLPHITTQRETTLEPVTPQTALTALAPSTISLLPNAGHQVFQRIAALTRRVPAFRLHVGSDMSHIPQSILHLLELCP